MNKSTLWLTCIILALLLIIGSMWFIRSDPAQLKPTVVIKKMPGDRVPYAVYLPQPYPDTSYIDTGQAYFYPLPVDSAAIAAMFGDYNTTRVYKDTLKKDSSALVVVTDTVRRNRLLGRRLDFQNNRSTAIYYTTTPTPVSRASFYGGVGFGRSPNEFGLVTTAGIQNKQGTLYTISYDIVQKDVYVTALWKLHKRIKIP